MKNLNRQELLDILYGATILGTGGGGSLTAGIAKIDDALAQGKEFKLVSFDELSPDDYMCTPYSCGAISPISEEERKKYERLPLSEKSPHVLAMEQMEQFLGKKLKAVISTELGGGNTASAFYCGAMADKLIVDGDPAGRSVPGLQHSTYFLHNVPIYPMSVMNKFGEGAVFTRIFDDFRAEDLVRALAVVSQNNIAVVDHVNTVGALKDTVIKGAISHAWKIGEAFRKAKEAGEDYAQAVAQAGGGVKIFQGEVHTNDWGTEDGFTLGTMTVAGVGDYAGKEYKIWYQNENIITWMDGEYYATVPDLVCVFNDDAREPLLNPYGEAGMKVSIIVLPAPDEWRTPRGLEVFGPKSFGHEIDWKPFCKK
jgi:DUF917 family protein